MVKRYIAVDLYRQRILIEASTHAELNKIILDCMDSPRQLPQAMWLYKIDESFLTIIKNTMRETNQSFAEATLPYKKFGGKN